MEVPLAIKRAATASKRVDQTDRPAAADGSSRKILRALLAFSTDRPRHSAESLSEQIGVPLSSTYRYIGILREADLIDEDGPRLVRTRRASIGLGCRRPAPVPTSPPLRPS